MIQAFRFDKATTYSQPVGLAQVMQSELTQALLYYLREVLEDEILARLALLYNQVEDEKTITWEGGERAIRANMVQPDALDLMEDLVTAVRESGSTLQRWTNRFALLRLAFKEANVEIPDSTLLKAVKRQVSRVELQFVKGDVSTFDAWKTAVDSIPIADLPAFDAKLCARVTEALPVLPAAKAKTRLDAVSQAGTRKAACRKCQFRSAYVASSAQGVCKRCANGVPAASAPAGPSQPTKTPTPALAPAAGRDVKDKEPTKAKAPQAQAQGSRVPRERAAKEQGEKQRQTGKWLGGAGCFQFGSEEG